MFNGGEISRKYIQTCRFQLLSAIPNDSRLDSSHSHSTTGKEIREVPCRSFRMHKDVQLSHPQSLRKTSFDGKKRNERLCRGVMTFQNQGPAPHICRWRCEPGCEPSADSYSGSVQLDPIPCLSTNNMLKASRLRAHVLPSPVIKDMFPITHYIR